MCGFHVQDNDEGANMSVDIKPKTPYYSSLNYSIQIY